MKNSHLVNLLPVAVCSIVLASARESTNFIAWAEFDAGTRAGYNAKFTGAKVSLCLSLALPKNQGLHPDSTRTMPLFVR